METMGIVGAAGAQGRGRGDGVPCAALQGPDGRRHCVIPCGASLPLPAGALVPVAAAALGPGERCATCDSPLDAPGGAPLYALLAEDAALLGRLVGTMDQAARGLRSLSAALLGGGDGIWERALSALAPHAPPPDGGEVLRLALSLEILERSLAAAAAAASPR